MEGALTARDRVGVQDFVLLEDFQSENAFIGNLRKRFKEKHIYVSKVENTIIYFLLCVICCYKFVFQTYIGSVLVSVNPYHKLTIYTPYIMENYKGVNFYEKPPHV